MLSKMLETELYYSRPFSPFREEIGEKELSVLSRHTKAILVEITWRKHVQIRHNWLSIVQEIAWVYYFWIFVIVYEELLPKNRFLRRLHYIFHLHKAEYKLESFFYN